MKLLSYIKISVAIEKFLNIWST